MVRHGKKFACAALMAMMLAVLPSQAATQATAPTTSSPAPQSAASPQATSAPAGAAKAGSTKAHTHHKKAPAIAEVPPTPPPPPTLEQQPPTAPQVSYRNGQLTIDAANSTLSSILRAIQVQTGASMDVPSAAGSERVAMRLGPGQPREVLHTLLNGSKFDYMILGVAGNPGAIQKVILTPKQAVGATTQASNNPQPAPSDDQDEGTPVADTGGESEYPGPSTEQPPMPPGAMRRPMGAPGGQQFQQNNNPQQSAFGQGNSDNIVKTPEQLMQELQEMQQQQQQYQEQLNPANQNPPQQPQQQ
jgi:hypothetical protein